MGERERETDRLNFYDDFMNCYGQFQSDIYKSSLSLGIKTLNMCHLLLKWLKMIILIG